MTQEHTYREKGRALFLTAMMVISVVAISALAGGVAAYDSDEQSESDLSNGDRLYQGQVGNVSTADILGSGSTAEERVDLYLDYDGDDERLVREYEIDNTGTPDPEYVEIDTTDLDEGDYTFVHNSAGQLEFSVASQNLDAEWDVDTISNVEGDTSNTSVEIDSTRASFPIEVSADGLNGDDLDTIFADEIVNDSDDTGEDFVVVEDRGTFDANFNGIDAGEYEFTFAAGDTAAEDTATINVTDDDIDVTFAESSYIVDRSNTAEITVDYDNADTAYVRVGDAEDVNYEVVFSVVDDEEAGEVTVDFDTTAAHTIDSGDEGGTHDAISTGDDATVEIVNVSAGGLGSPLGDGDYELSVGTGWNAGDGEITQEGDTAFLTLDTRDALGEDALGPETAPDSVSDAEDYGETTVTATDTIAEDDELLLTLETDSLYGYFDGADDLSDLNTDEVWLEIAEQDNQPNFEPQVWTTNETDGDADYVDVGDNVTVVDSNQSEGHVVLSVDYTGLGLSTDNTYDADFIVGEDNQFAAGDDEDEVASTSFTLEERSLEWDDSAEEVPASSGATVTGTTNVAPGTELDTRARSSGVFTHDADAVVEAADGDNTFEASYDLAAYDAGTEFTLTAMDSGGADDAEIDATLGEGTGDGELAVAISDVSVADGEDADVSATVSAGADAVSGTAAITLNGDEVHSEELDLDAEESATVETTISADDLTVGEHDLEVTFDDASSSGTLTVEEGGDDGSSDDGSTDDDSMSDDDSSSDDSSSDDDSSDDGGDGVPGFGVAVALAALLGAALLATRRQD